MKTLQALLALFAFAFLPLNAADLSDLTVNSAGRIVDCKTSATGELIIPSRISSRNVRSIGRRAFAGCTSLTSITIPGGVGHIEEEAFAGCTSLTSITIPSHLSFTHILAGTFRDCTSLTSITIPGGVGHIEEEAFAGCTSLTSIIFRGDAPTTVSSNAFTGVADGAAAHVTIEALSSFGASGDDWNGLTVDTILTWTTTDGEVTITDCNTAASGELVIPDTIEGNPVTSIGGSAFRDCTSLTSITIPDSVTSIGGSAFRDCTSLTSITIPDSVTSIGSSAFRDCTSLTSITIPDSVTSIEIWAFGNCSSLTTIEVGAGNVNYTDVNGVLFNKDMTLLCAYPAGKTVDEYTLPDSVTSIGNAAFWGCTSLTSITIPDSVTSIGNYAFLDCTSLTSITFMGTAPWMGNRSLFNVAPGAVAIILGEKHASFGDVGDNWNGLILNCIDGALCWLTWTTTDGEVTITDCNTAASGELVIPDTIEGNPVTSIGGSAFRDCTSLTSITIPDSVTSIGDLAFGNCSSLTTIEVGAGNVNYTEVNGVLFNKDMTLLCAYPAGKTVDEYTLPDSVTRIGNAAFWGCSRLTSITIPDSVTYIGSWAFLDCTSLTSITFMGTAPRMGSRSLFNVADGAVAIVSAGEQATFGGVGADWNGLAIACNDGALCWLTWTTTDGEVTITDCNTAASGELVIPDTIEGNPVTSIGSLAFRDCTSLTSITIPDSVTSIEGAAFSLCSSLTSITIPDGVTSIANFAFYLCTSLASITIPDSVTSIGSNAFYSCTSLTNITIPDSVTSIGDGAFLSCTSLTSVYFLGAPPTVGAFGNAAAGAKAIVPIQFIEDFGGNGAVWNGLVVEENEILANPGKFGLVTQEAYETLVAAYTAAIVERDARPTQAAYDAAEAERDARPTQAALTEAIAQRDARFTEDQINAMTTNPTVGRNAAGNMQVDISFIHSTDLKTFTPFAVSPAWVSVVDGKIALEFPPSDENTFFYRLGVQ